MLSWFYCFIFCWDRVSCSPRWFSTNYIAKENLEDRFSFLHLLHVGWQACASMSGLCGGKDWTQRFLHGRPALYQLSPSPSIWWFPHYTLLHIQPDWTLSFKVWQSYCLKEMQSNSKLQEDSSYFRFFKIHVVAIFFHTQQIYSNKMFPWQINHVLSISSDK